MSDAPLWQPSEERRNASTMMRFMNALSADLDVPLETFRDLHAFSVDRMEDFWSELWDFCDVRGTKGERVLVDGDDMLAARFFPDARLNYAANLLTSGGGEPAIIFRAEDRVRDRVSWDELRSAVGAVRAALEAAGVRAGDRVAGVVPNMPQTVMAFLGAASMGAVWSSCSPDFGPRGILDRFGQIAPKVLFTCDGYYYNGRTFPLADKIAEVLGRLPGVEKVVVIDLTGNAAEVAAALGARAVTWDDFLAPHAGAEPRFDPLPFDHPLYILFSSGTTGVPKCIVHRAGGILLKHLCELKLHGDIRPGDRLFYFSTCGWMMWNWLVSGLAAGATLLLYDGSPFHPGPEALFDYAEAEGMTQFGTSAKYIDAVRKSGLVPAERFDLSGLRAMFSTGSPLSPEGFDFVYSGIAGDIHLASISGGTDICGCFVAGNPLEPVWRGEIQGPVLGMAVDVWSEDGKPLRGGKGELVCTRPFPTRPLMFWNDPDGRKYRAAYYERFPGVWHHGDFAEWTEHGGIVIHGRSDATLNPGGVRIGTAEIYAQVEKMPEVLEALAIGQKTPDNDERIVLFVRLAEGVELTDDLEREIRTRIRTGASPRHVPAVIAEVADIPRTKSGKIVEIAVRDVVHGREVKNIEALANPEALELFRDHPRLRF